MIDYARYPEGETDTPSHPSTRIKASIPPNYSWRRELEWVAGWRVPSAQKAIEMGEWSVKLGVTEDCALRYVGSLSNIGILFFRFISIVIRLRLRTTFQFQWVNNSVLFEKKFSCIILAEGTKFWVYKEAIYLQIYSSAHLATGHRNTFLVETKGNEPARNDLRSYIEY